MTQKAGKILLGDSAIPETPLSLDDLKKIANDNSGKYSMETRQAAQYFVDNPTEFTKVDGSNVNKQSDGFITKAEIRGYFASTPNAPDNLYKAAQGMVNDPNLPTGPLSVDDLKMIANDPKYTQEARDGAKFFSENPTEFKKADLDGNGFLSKDELSKFLGSTGKPQSFPATDENTQNAVKGLQNFAGLPKPFTKADLQRIADDQTADSTVRSNAQYLIDHPDEFDKVDTAGKDGRTGSITEDDMNAYLSQGGHEADVKKNAQILLSDPTTGAMVHNTGVTVDDLKKIVADPNSSSDAKAAAQFFLDNPQDFQRLSGAGSGGKADGLVNDGDIAAYLAERQVVTDGSPDHTRGVMTDLLQDPSVTFPLSTDALQRIAADNTGKYSDKTKFAAQYLLDNRAEFDSVDRASDKSLDGIISKDDALNYMVPPASPDQTKAMTDVLTHNGSLQWPLTQDSLKEIMNNESVNLDTRNAARYFVNHPEEFNNVPVFKPIDGIQPPEDNTNANAAWAADKLRDPNATIYRSNGQTVGTWDGLNTDDLYGIANNSANSLDVRRAALFFAQHRERFDATDQVYNAKDGSISRGDLDKYYYQMTPLWQAPEENSGYDDYYDPVLSKYMHDNNVQSMSKADLEYLRDDITKDHALREAADYWLRFKLTPGYQTVRVQDVDDDRRPDSPTDSGGGGAL